MKDLRAYILGLCDKKEGYVVEFKSAKGGFPGTFWDTYSSFANTAGGIIVLGIREKDNKFVPDGLTEEQIYKYKKIFWDGAHNPHIVNMCLPKEQDVREEQDGDAHYLVINIPRATYDQKPIYIKGDPFHGHTFRRNHEGDYACSDEEVRRMLADSIVTQYGLDRRVIESASIEKDLDADTLRQYRNAFRARHEGHPWNELSDADFLSRIKGIAEDPQTQKVGITAAAILMFGKHESMYKVSPYYFVDFREKLSTDPRVRYTDRYYPDGMWEPNLFQFYNRVYRNMDQAIPHPFKLDADMQRIDETAADESLREAICNCLLHANWGMMSGVVIERYPDRFVFINPGTMLVPVEDFFKGGKSICRNPYLQDMFVAIGRGEHMGSGADIIEKGWKENGWPNPELKEIFGAQTESVELTLRLGGSPVISPEQDGKSSGQSSGQSSERVKSMIKANATITLDEIATEMKISRRAVEKIVRKLREAGEIRHKGPNKGGEWEVLQ
jgi:ATP-dependent DNA helicase RecG